MISQRQLFLQHVGQTSDAPMAIEVEKAEGIYLYDTAGKEYIDLISGVSVSNVGHRHPKVVNAIKAQVDKYMHLMVYGEYIQSPQVLFAKKISDLLPEKLNSVYFVNSGSEANEGAMKLAKRYTGRSEIISCKDAYHGSTHGALSLMSDTEFTQAFRPLLPGIRYIRFNEEADLSYITTQTAAVVVEAVQGEGGVIPAQASFMKKLRQQCDRTGCLLIIDEVQTGFGRTGKLFGFMHYDIVPDIISLAKGMGGGMPIGAFVADKAVMDVFQSNPVLGHITTFGGHPVSAAAAVATLDVLINEKLIQQVATKGKRLIEQLKHPLIRSIRGLGLFYSVELADAEQIQTFIKEAVRQGILTDWFLFDDTRFRIAPPLTITNSEIDEAVRRILKALHAI